MLKIKQNNENLTERVIDYYLIASVVYIGYVVPHSVSSNFSSRSEVWWI